MKPKAMVSWSSGKDSAFALYEARRSGEYDVVGVFTTLTREFSRVSIHGTREALLDRQAAALGLPLFKAYLPFPCPNEAYEAAMADLLARIRAEGVTHLVFGDLFLQDVRDYRVAQLAPTGLQPVFPLWGRPTDVLVREMLAAGLQTVIVSLDPQKVPADLAGRALSPELLAELPPGVDPCGENGEFHTCVMGGPMFSAPIPYAVGETVERGGFRYVDLLPLDEALGG